MRISDWSSDVCSSDLRDAHDRIELARSIAEIHALDHDAIVEPFIDGSDLEVPVITLAGEPAVLTMMIFEQDDPAQLRTYKETRDLVGQVGCEIKRLDDPVIAVRVDYYHAGMADVFRPFDY